MEKDVTLKELENMGFAVVNQIHTSYQYEWELLLESDSKIRVQLVVRGDGRDVIEETGLPRQTLYWRIHVPGVQSAEDVRRFLRFIETTSANTPA